MMGHFETTLTNTASFLKYPFEVIWRCRETTASAAAAAATASRTRDRRRRKEEEECKARDRGGGLDRRYEKAHRQTRGKQRRAR